MTYESYSSRYLHHAAEEKELPRPRPGHDSPGFTSSGYQLKTYVPPRCGPHLYKVLRIDDIIGFVHKHRDYCEGPPQYSRGRLRTQALVTIVPATAVSGAPIEIRAMKGDLKHCSNTINGICIPWLSEIRTFGGLPFAFHAHLPNWHRYFSLDDCVCQVAVM